MDYSSYFSKILRQIEVPVLTLWCVFFCLGISIQSALNIAPTVLLSSAFILLLPGLIFIRRHALSSFFLFLTALISGMLVLAQAAVLPVSSISRMSFPKGTALKLKGLVVSEPQNAQEKTSFILAVRELEFEDKRFKVSGKVLARLKGKEGLLYGDSLVFKGRLYRPPRFSFNGRLDYREILRRRGIYFIAHIAQDGLLITARGGGNFFQRLALKSRRRLEDVLFSNLSSFSAGVFSGMLLGDQVRMPAVVRQEMTKTGTWHVMVVSGSHTALVAMLVFLILKILRLPRQPRYWMVIIVLVFYAAVTGGSGPVVRATVMSAALLLSFVVRRNPLFYNSLCLALLVILFFDPYQLFNAGLQLSFLSVGFIVWLYPKLKRFFPERVFDFRPFGFLIGVFCVSVSAWLGTVPVIAYHFLSFSWVTVLANMFIVSLAMLAVMAGFSLLTAALCFKSLIVLLAPACDSLLFFLLKLNSFFAALPWACVKIPRFSLTAVLAYYAILMITVNLYPGRDRMSENP